MHGGGGGVPAPSPEQEPEFLGIELSHELSLDVCQ